METMGVSMVSSDGTDERRGRAEVAGRMNEGLGTGEGLIVRRMWQEQEGSREV